MEKTKIKSASWPHYDCLFVIKFSIDIMIDIITKSSSYHYEIKQNKNRFVTVLWSQSAIRVEKIKISRKRDLHKIIIISLWDHLHKDDFRIWGYEKKKFCDRIGYSWEGDRHFEKRRSLQNQHFITMRSFRDGRLQKLRRWVKNKKISFVTVLWSRIVQFHSKSSCLPDIFCKFDGDLRGI